MKRRELYRNDFNPEDLVISVPSEMTVTEITLSSPGGETKLTDTVPPTNEGTISVAIPFKHIKYDGYLTAYVTGMIDGEEHVLSYRIPVVTPLFTLDDFSEAQQGQIGENDFPELERLVRHVVEAHCGQSFGYRKDAVEFNNSRNRVYLNAPIVEFTGVSDRYLTNSNTLSIPHRIYDDRFVIDLDLYDVKTDLIMLPHKRTNRVMFLHGTFGYPSVPEDVRQAALLIAGVWGCNQAIWRDRYINTIRSADWNIKYDGGAYEGTGSATADQLLAKYNRVDGFMAVI